MGSGGINRDKLGINNATASVRLLLMDQKIVNIVRENFIVQELVREIGSGVALIGAIDDVVYRTGEKASGSIGSHFRHNLDFVNSFLNGIAERRIDYLRRMR